MSNDWQWNSPDWRKPDDANLDRGLGNYPTQQSSGNGSNYEQYSDPVSLPPPPPPPPYPSYESSGSPATPTPYSYYGGQSNDYAQPTDPFGPPPGGGFPYTPPPAPVARRRGRLWLVIPVLIVLVLCAGGVAGAVFAFHAFSSAANQAIQQAGNTIGSTGSSAGPVTVTVGAQPTIVIDRNDGAVQIQSVADSQQVTIEPTGANASEAFGPITYSKSTSGGSGTTITFDLSNVETIAVLLKVPAVSNLNISTNDGAITVVGVTGQQMLDNNDGNLNVTQDTLMGKSTLDTNGGSITFSGTLDTQSTDTFSTNPEPITITLPANANFHADISNNGGTITSDFPQVVVSDDDDSASGDVGHAPFAQLEVDSNGGAIQLNKAAS